MAFGGLLGEKTGNLIGISETLLLSSVGGTLFALFSGMPLIITGVTGPLLLYDESLFGICSDYDIGGWSQVKYLGFMIHSSEKKMFMLDEIVQRNASKFGIFYIYETQSCFSIFHCVATLFIFSLMNALVYVEIGNRKKK